MIKRGKAEKSTARDERLSAALRENLKRRKEQARKRDLTRRSDTGDAAAKDAPVEASVPEFRRNRVRE